MSRSKWEVFLRGEDVGGMFAPLVDKWCLDEPYYWPFDQPEPFLERPEYHHFREQLAMAGVCGYDALFYVLPPFVYSHGIETGVHKRIQDGREITETTIKTPYGDMVSVVETDRSTSSRHETKSFIETEEDYRKFIWFTEMERKLDKAQSVARGRELLSPVGDKGMVGTWWNPPEVTGISANDLFYHMVDYEELYREAVKAKFETDMNKLETLKAMGFDFLFYVVPGTEMYSPSLMEEYVLPYTGLIFEKWRSLGGFIVWHSCGHIAEFIKRGYYDLFLPEIFETMSQPPVGNLPSLKWGRERLDPRIATKGNIDLQLIRDGGEMELRAEVRRVMEETKGYRHIIGASDNILQMTPAANLRVLADEACK